MDRGLDPSPKPMGAGSGTFDSWLQHKLQASQLTQRQLAEKAGIDHSTISRLINGRRVPSLRTATSLAQALGVPDGTAPEALRSVGWKSRPADVEHALRSDESLTEVDVRHVMERYLAARRNGNAGPAPSAPKSPPQITPVPIVIQIPGGRAVGPDRRPGPHRRSG
jgi:transcriptional regulator with XRE-family HTH domain